MPAIAFVLRPETFSQSGKKIIIFAGCHDFVFQADLFGMPFMAGQLTPLPKVIP